MNIFIGVFGLVLLSLAACTFPTKNKSKIEALHPDICAPYMNGLFTNEAGNYRVLRNGNSQIEYDLSTETEYHFEVHWLYNCAYNLIFKHSTNPSDTFMLKENDKMRIQFTDIVNDTISYQVEFKDQIFESKLIKLE